MLAPTAAPAPAWDDDAGLERLRRPRDRSPRERTTAFSCRLVPGGHPGGRRSRGLEHVPVKWSRDTYGLRELHTRFPSPLGGLLRKLAEGRAGRILWPLSRIQGVFGRF